VPDEPEQPVASEERLDAEGNEAVLAPSEDADPIVEPWADYGSPEEDPAVAVSVVPEWADVPEPEESRLPEPSVALVPVADWSEEPAPQRNVVSVAVAERPVRDDPFRRSLDAVLAELTAPVAADAERQTRVAVRVTASAVATAPEGPLTLPSRPELVSGDFLAQSEVGRPALVLNDAPKRSTPQLPPRAFALVAGALVLVVTLAFMLCRY